MLFSEFAKLLQKLENTPSRNEMVKLMADFLKLLKPEEVAPAMYMLKGRVSPGFVPLEFNFSTNLLIKAISEGFKRDLSEIKMQNANLGDIGLVLETIVDKSSSDVSLLSVYEHLVAIAQVEGKGAQKIKSKMFVEIVKNLDKVSSKFVCRIVVGGLRIGMSDKTILEALSWVSSGDKSLKKEIEKAFGLRSDLGEIAKIILIDGVSGLESITIRPGVPVASKLVQREKSSRSALERMEVALVQPKYDGLRLQAHFDNDGFDNNMNRFSGDLLNLGFEFKEDQIEKVRLFSRNMESLTEMFPDVVSEISKLGVDSIVLDCEAIGVDPKTGSFISFQETVKRKRKYDIKAKSEDTPIKVFVFDILYLNSKDVSQLKLSERMGLLEELFKKDQFRKSAIFEFSKTEVFDDFKKLESTFRGYLKEGLEGVIIKDPNSKYLPGTRNYDWIKIKANTYSELVDDIDCVILGYYKGRGARAKFGVGAFLVGVYNQNTEKFESVAKVGSGVKDDEWERFAKEVDKIKVEKLPQNVSLDKSLMPDVICEPQIVVVVNADEISKSKVHSAGRDDSGQGYSLRFPRLKEWRRMDKSPVDITTVEEISQIYELKYKR